MDLFLIGLGSGDLYLTELDLMLIFEVVWFQGTSDSFVSDALGSPLIRHVLFWILSDVLVLSGSAGCCH